MKKAVHFLVYSSIYLALCAVVMCYQTSLLFNLASDEAFLCFVFFGTLCSYNFHWYFTYHPNPVSDRISWSLNNKPLHITLFCIGLVGASYTAFLLRAHWPALLVSIAIAFLYSAPKVPLPLFKKLKRIAIGKTIFLALAWTFITAILPVMISRVAWTPGMETFAVNRFFFLYPICILFDYRDRTEDAAEGIRSMITQLDEKGVDVIFWGSVVVAVLSAGLLCYFGIRPEICILLTLPAILLAVLYKPSKKNKDDLHYYFLLDGLMMLSGLFLLLGSFT
ncbi:MAG TPA: UbiA family prenyltransferase [Flavisolibacter sp.]